jgi:hypothetical protein
VSQQRLRKDMPGDELAIWWSTYTEHAPMHLRKLSARLFSKGHEEQEEQEEQEGAIISHLELSGTPSISEDQPSHSQSALQTSELRLSLCQRRSLLMRSLASTG